MAPPDLSEYPSESAQRKRKIDELGDVCSTSAKRLRSALSIPHHVLPSSSSVCQSMQDLFLRFPFISHRLYRIPSLPPGTVLTEPSEAVRNEGLDNADDDYICRVGDYICGSGTTYTILACLGKGAFGQVLRCRVADTRKHVAMKIVKQTACLADMAVEVETEIRALELVKHSSIVNMLDCFDHVGHKCIVFEILGLNLLEVLERHGKPGLPSGFIAHTAEQLLSALQKLREVFIIHGDLKPENVLVVDLARFCWGFGTTRVKLIDFGGSRCCERIAEDENIVIQTIPYRAPEVLLGMAFSSVADMWSLGCVCVELCLGDSLFPHSQGEDVVVRCINQVLGPIPNHMLKAGTHTGRYFRRVEQDGRQSRASGWHSWATVPRFTSFLKRLFGGGPSDTEFIYAIKDSDEGAKLPNCLPASLKAVLEIDRYEVTRNIVGGPRRLRGPIMNQQRLLRRNFVDFLERLLQVDPNDRALPLDALSHPFITNS